MPDTDKRRAVSGSARFLTTFASCLLLTASVGRADVFLPEAAKSSGYGPTRVGYSLAYSGACGETVGASISYMSRTDISDALPEALQYARDSVPHLLAKCAEVQTVIVDLRGSAASPPLFYRFEMRRTDDWAPTQLARNVDLADALLQSGYLPMQGPLPISRYSYVRWRDGRLDIVYGNRLHGRMAATHVEKKMITDANPPRVSHYVVRGNWYEIGNEKPDGGCPTSREGYALWGSFSMTLSPWSDRFDVQRRSCADHESDARDERIMFSNLMGSDLRQFGIESFRIGEVLTEGFEASGRFVEDSAAENFADTRQPLHATENLRIYPRAPDLCAHTDLDAVYRINSEQRDSAFGGNYTRTIGGLARRIINERCANPLTVSVTNYRNGDAEPWDRMSFQIRPDRPAPFGGDENYLSLIDHHPGNAAKAHDEWLARNVLGPACTDGVFCDLPGGRYLNAVYRGDLDAIRQMDYLYAQSVNEFVGTAMPAGESNNPINQIFGALLNVEEIQLLKDAANKYLYSYAAWGESCLDPGAQARTFIHVEPVIVETDEWGVTTTSGGERYEATYTLNPEFFELRDRVGSYYGARNSDDVRNLPEKAQVYIGIVQMKNAYGCRSDEVKQFERQLRELTARVLDDPGTIPPTTANLPPSIERTMAPPFAAVPAAESIAATRIAMTAPADLPAVAAPAVIATQRTATAPAAVETGRTTSTATSPATVAPAGTPAPAATSPLQRQQKINAELAEAGQRYQQEMVELNTAMQLAIRDAGTAEARTAAMAEYQEKLADIQRRALEETQRIRQQN